MTETNDELLSRVRRAEAERDRVARELHTIGEALDRAGAPRHDEPDEDGELASRQLSTVERIRKVHEAMVAKDVDALIGVKILPFQRQTFIDLAVRDRAAFDTIVQGLPEHRLLGRKMETDPNPRPRTGASQSAGNGEELGELFDESEPDDSLKEESERTIHHAL